MHLQEFLKFFHNLLLLPTFITVRFFVYANIAVDIYQYPEEKRFGDYYLLFLRLL